MKTITRDTVRALMQDTSVKRNKALMKCGYTIDDIKDAESMYNALYNAPDPFPPPKNWYLITYTWKSKGHTETNFAHDITQDIIKWLDDVQKYENETHVLINYFPIDEETAKRWDGNLKSM
jgi:hypothetical protein